MEEEARSGPSLPIILFSAAFGIATAVAGFYLAWEVATLRLEWAVVAGVLALCIGLGASGAFLSAVTGSRAAMANIGMSCGLIVVTLLFFGLCTVVGALAATLMIALGS